MTAKKLQIMMNDNFRASQMRRDSQSIKGRRGVVVARIHENHIPRPVKICQIKRGFFWVNINGDRRAIIYFAGQIADIPASVAKKTVICIN